MIESSNLSTPKSFERKTHTKIIQNWMYYHPKSSTHRRDLLAKKESDPKPKPTVWESKAVVCQRCQFHSNNPSRCTSNDYFIGRKTEGCEIFTTKKI